MSQMNYYLQRLHDHAQKNMDLSGRYHLAAGIIKSREIHNLSTNYAHFHHAEASALKKHCLLRHERKVAKG